MNFPINKLRTPLDYQMRKWERTYLSFETKLSTYCRFFLPVRVINFSKGGFLVATEVQLKPGEEVLLELPNIGEATGRITWSARGRAGGCFNNMIDVHALVQSLENEQ